MSEPISNSLEDNILAQKRLKIEQQLLLSKYLKSENPDMIMKAMEIQAIETVKYRHDSKAVLLEDQWIAHNGIYRGKAGAIDYYTLESMARTPAISAIIKTRKNQVGAFCEPQSDRTHTGFVVEKIGSPWIRDKQKLTKEEEKEREWLTNWVLNCGEGFNDERPDFENFIRVATEQLLVYDQWNYENVFNGAGRLVEVDFVEPKSMKLAVRPSINDPSYQDAKIAGRYPKYIQIIDERAVANFYPWELCWGMRNPQYDLRRRGYGRSEMEDMITVITGLINSEEYNRSIFKNGTMPSGLISIKPSQQGGMDAMGPARIDELKNDIKLSSQGVANVGRTLILPGDATYTPFNNTNNDMQWANWNDFQTKLACAHYCISPSEIGFTDGQSSDNNSSFEKDNSKKIKYSKDKGLKPLLTSIFKFFNQSTIRQLTDKWMVKPVGLDAESETERLDRISKQVTNYMTINEIRKNEGFPPIDGGDIIMNGIYTSAMQQEKMAQQQQQQGGNGGGNGDDGGNDDQNPFEDEVSKAYKSYLFSKEV